MKKSTRVIMVAVGLALGASQANATGIPVIDAGNLTNNIVSHVESITKFAEQIRQLEAQLNQARQMYSALNGIRGMGSLLNNPALRQYIPKSYADLYKLGDGIGAGRYSGLSGSIKAIKTANRIVKKEDFKNPTGRAAKMIDKAQTELSTMEASAKAAYDNASQRFEDLQVLVDKVNTVDDQKAALDLQARIQAEQVMMQNELTKLQLMQQLQTVQEQQRRQEAHEIGIAQARGTILYAE